MKINFENAGKISFIMGFFLLCIGFILDLFLVLKKIILSNNVDKIIINLSKLTIELNGSSFYFKGLTLLIIGVVVLCIVYRNNIDIRKYTKGLIKLFLP